MSNQSFDFRSHKYEVITTFLKDVINYEANSLPLKIEAAEAWDAMNEQESYDPAIEFLQARFPNTMKTNE